MTRFIKSERRNVVVDFINDFFTVFIELLNAFEYATDESIKLKQFSMAVKFDSKMLSMRFMAFLFIEKKNYKLHLKSSTLHNRVNFFSISAVVKIGFFTFFQVMEIFVGFSLRGGVGE
jgi:hypothetical protein